MDEELTSDCIITPTETISLLPEMEGGIRSREKRIDKKTAIGLQNSCAFCLKFPITQSGVAFSNEHPP
jgi:hypothetical protein